VSASLPRIDEHEIVVNAPAEVTWPIVIAVFAHMTSGSQWRTLARVLHCRPDRAAGQPNVLGSTVPGFRVARSEAPTTWGLEGEHLFSRYALTFRVVPLDGARSAVRAESSAEFPGYHGRAYRALVIGTRGHVFGVRNILHRIKAGVEHSVNR
jgi:hypothetical protein